MPSELFNLPFIHASQDQSLISLGGMTLPYTKIMYSDYSKLLHIGVKPSDRNTNILGK